MRCGLIEVFRLSLFFFFLKVLYIRRNEEEVVVSKFLN